MIDLLIVFAACVAGAVTVYGAGLVWSWSSARRRADVEFSRTLAVPGGVLLPDGMRTGVHADGGVGRRHRGP